MNLTKFTHVYLFIYFFNKVDCFIYRKIYSNYRKIYKQKFFYLFIIVKSIVTIVNSYN